MRAEPDAVPRSDAVDPLAARVEGGSDCLFSAVEGSPLPMILVDPHRLGEPIVLANGAFSRLTGYDLSEIVGRNCRFLQGPGSDPAAVERMRHAIASRTSLSVEILNYRKDGTPFRNAVHLSPVFGRDGSLCYLLASQVEDPDPPPAAEDTLTAGSSQQPAQEPAAGLAHDLRNMLQVIAGSMEVIARQAKASGDDRLIRRVGAVAEATARANALGDALAAVAHGRTSGLRAKPAPPAPLAAPSPREAEAGPGGGRILVVDDRTEIADLARTMLESSGYRVEVAGSGEAALDRLSDGFDLLFTDLVMPGPLDGLALAQAARRRHPGLRVLLTTGDAHRAAAQDGARGGEFATIVKPYRRADLVDTVRRLLDGPAGPAPL